MSTTHALEEMIGVNYGVVVECRCGWVEHVKPGQFRGVAWDARSQARHALKLHKLSVTNTTTKENNS